MASKAIHYKVPFVDTPYTKDINGTIVKMITPRIVVPNIDTITEEGRNRMIRHIHNADTIYVDEQVKAGFPLKDEKGNFIRPTELDRITIIDGNLFAYPDRDKNLIEYLEKCTYNGGSKFRGNGRGAPLFIKVDTAAEAQISYDKETQTYEAKKIILESKDKETLRRLGKALLGNVDSLEDVELKNKLLTIATKDPSKITTITKSLQGDMSDLVEEAERLGVIQILATKVIYKSTDETITTYKIGSAGKSKLSEYLRKPENESQLAALKVFVKDAKMESVGKDVASV